jgi:hypothetical protein
MKINGPCRARGQMVFKEWAVLRIIREVESHLLGLVSINTVRFLVLVAVALVTVARPVKAAEPQVTIVVSSVDALRADMKYLVQAAPTDALKKEWKNLDETIESFLQGVGSTLPIGFEIQFGADGTTYQLAVPVTALKGANGFLENVKALGYNIKEDKDGFYTLQQAGGGKTPPPPAFLKGAGAKYVYIGEGLKRPGVKLDDPELRLQSLVTPPTDLAVVMANDVAGLDGRRTSFAETRKQLEAGIKFKRGEDEATFKLRELATKQQLAELERFVVEAEQLVVNWSTDDAAGVGHGTFLLKAIADTDLAKSVQLLGQKPSRFAGVKLQPNPVLSGKVNFAIDPMRAQNIEDFLIALEPVALADADQRPHLTADGKAAAKSAITQALAIVKAGRSMGVFDGFIDLHAAATPGEHGLIAAVRTVNGLAASDIFALIPKIRGDWSFAAGKHSYGGVTVHELGIPERRQTEFQDVFGKSCPAVIYVGVAEDAIWLAAGPEILPKLEAAIEQAATPGEASSTVLTGTIKLGPLVQVLDAQRNRNPLPAGKPKAEVDQRKQADRLRKLAIEAFKTDEDTLVYSLGRDGENVVGDFRVGKAVLKFIGGAIADFSKENLR